MMKVSELAMLIGASCRNAMPGSDREITGGYSCDLLSWSMSRLQPGMVWITVQTHMNVIAVAVMCHLSAVILPEGNAMESAVLEKAAEEGVTILETPLSAYEISARMAAAGIPPLQK